MNLGLDATANASQWRHDMIHAVLPQLADFKADIILVSAGFDAHIKVRGRVLVRKCGSVCIGVCVYVCRMKLITATLA